MPIFRREQEYQTLPPASPVIAATTRSEAPSPTPAPAPTPAAPAAADASAPSTLLPVNREAAAVVDKKTDVKGTLHSQGNVLIEGCFNGELEAKETIWVEKGANTQGQLHSNDAVISGTFDGEIVSQHRLQIAATATVSGEIDTPVLVIEEGATINCRFSMKRTRR